MKKTTAMTSSAQTYVCRLIVAPTPGFQGRGVSASAVDGALWRLRGGADGIPATESDSLLRILTV